MESIELKYTAIRNSPRRKALNGRKRQKNIISDIDWEQISAAAAEQGIRWRFNQPNNRFLVGAVDTNGETHLEKKNKS